MCIHTYISRSLLYSLYMCIYVCVCVCVCVCVYKRDASVCTPPSPCGVSLSPWLLITPRRQRNHANLLAWEASLPASMALFRRELGAGRADNSWRLGWTGPQAL